VPFVWYACTDSAQLLVVSMVHQAITQPSGGESLGP